MCPEKNVCSAAGPSVLQMFGASGWFKVLLKSPVSCWSVWLSRPLLKVGHETFTAELSISPSAPPVFALHILELCC